MDKGVTDEITLSVCLSVPSCMYEVDKPLLNVPSMPVSDVKRQKHESQTNSQRCHATHEDKNGHAYSIQLFMFTLSIHRYPSS